MNPRIKIFNDIREDISDYLFHFTKGEDALIILDKIINEGAINCRPYLLCGFTNQAHGYVDGNGLRST